MPLRTRRRVVVLHHVLLCARQHLEQPQLRYWLKVVNKCSQEMCGEKTFCYSCFHDDFCLMILAQAQNVKFIQDLHAIEPLLHMSTVDNQERQLDQDCAVHVR